MDLVFVGLVLGLAGLTAVLIHLIDRLHATHRDRR